ncbi:MAG: hypothetical protein Q9160_002399 [Pyrenula sp. 1 TL-2023]
MSEKSSILRRPVAQPEEPPPYSSEPTPSSPPATSTSHSVVESIPGYGNINFSNYIPENATLSDDHTTVTCYNPRLCSNPVALGKFLEEQAALPPKLLLHVRGTHSSNTSMSPIIDFNLTINLTPLLIPQSPSQPPLHYTTLAPSTEETYRGGTTKTRAPTTSPSSTSSTDLRTLPQWLHKFASDPSKHKSFTLIRIFSNLNTSYLEGQIRNLLASTAYRGHLSISFPTTYSTVIITNANPGGSLFGVNLMALFGGGTKRYEVARAVWPFADAAPEGRGIGGQGRRCAAGLSEEAWWETWREAVRFAAVRGRRGAVTVEDRVEVKMNPMGAGVGVGGRGGGGGGGGGKVVEWGVE